MHLHGDRSVCCRHLCPLRSTARPAFHPYQTDTKAEAQTLSKVATQGLQSVLWSEANKALLFSPHRLGDKWPSGVTFPRIQSSKCLHLNTESQEKRSATLLSQTDFQPGQASQSRTWGTGAVRPSLGFLICQDFTKPVSASVGA